MADLFSLSEATLLAGVTQVFTDNKIEAATRYYNFLRTRAFFIYSYVAWILILFIYHFYKFLISWFFYVNVSLSYLFNDVNEAITACHTSGIMHRTIMQNPEVAQYYYPWRH